MPGGCPENYENRSPSFQGPKEQSGEKPWKEKERARRASLSQREGKIRIPLEKKNVCKELCGDAGSREERAVWLGKNPDQFSV